MTSSVYERETRTRRLRMQAPSPRRGEGWDEGGTADVGYSCPNPLTPTLSPPGTGRRGARANRIRSIVGLLLAAAFVSSAAAQDVERGRRLYLEKADCQYCHGWAGDGAGAPQAPAGANLRRSQLQRDQLAMVIACGIPGTPMPHFDDGAYTDTRCYGTTEAELGGRTPPFPPSNTLVKREIDALVDYLLAKIVNKGPVTRAECIENFGERARSCNDYPAGP